MNLDRAQVVIRPRTAWEAVDLGYALAWRFRGAVFAAWWVTAAPVCALILALTWDRFWLSVLCLWWAKALFDRVPLFVLSRAIFGATPRLGEVLRALPGLWARHALTGVTVYRLHPLRLYLLAVPELEGLRLGARVKRERTLARRGSSEASICAFTGLVFEVLLALTVVMLAYVLLPTGTKPDVGALFGLQDPETLGATSAVVRVALVLAMGFAGPMHVGAGFALYLNRRVHLEGWDVELAFRRLALRLARPGATRLGRVGVAGLFGPALLALPLLAGAPQEGGEPDPRAVADEVLSRDVFDTTKEVTIWVPPWADWGGGDFGGLGGLGNLLAPLFILLGAALLAWFVYMLVKKGGWSGGRRREEVAPPPTHAFGLDLRPESLPDDVPGAAWGLWCAGDRAGATGLLYRAAISRLVERDGLALEAGDTEGDCLSRAAGFLPDTRAGFFRRVTRAWQTSAYSSGEPEEDEVDALCRGWRGHFEGSVAS